MLERAHRSDEARTATGCELWIAERQLAADLLETVVWINQDGAPENQVQTSWRLADWSKLRATLPSEPIARVEDYHARSGDTLALLHSRCCRRHPLRRLRRSARGSSSAASVVYKSQATAAASSVVALTAWSSPHPPNLRQLGCHYRCHNHKRPRRCWS